MPYWLDDETNDRAKLKLAGVVALTLGTTGVRYACICLVISMKLQNIYVCPDGKGSLDAVAAPRSRQVHVLGEIAMSNASTHAQQHDQHHGRSDS